MAPQGHSSSMPTTPSKRSKTTSPQSTPTKSCLKPDSSDLIFVLDLGRKEVKFDLSGNEEHEADIYDRTPILVDEVPQEEMLVLLANRNGIDTTKENWADLFIAHMQTKDELRAASARASCQHIAQRESPSQEYCW